MRKRDVLKIERNLFLKLEVLGQSAASKMRHPIVERYS